MPFRILAAFLSLWLAVTPAGAGSMLLLGAGGSGGSSLDPATTAWVNQVITNGGTVSGGRQTIVNTFIVCLKTNSLFTILDRYWLLAGENTQSALTDMVALASATNSGATFTASQGYAGNGSSTFVDTGYNPSTGTHYAQNSAVLGGQVQTSRTIGSNTTNYGQANAGFTVFSRVQALSGGGNATIAINEAGDEGTTNANARASYIGSRTGASAGELYQNGSALQPILNASAAVASVNFYIGGVNQAGSLVAGSTDQMSSFFAGGGWNATQAGNFETCQNAMMTSIGINVH